MTPAERMSDQAKRLAAVLREHLPKDRYDDDDLPAGTFCTGCDWQGDYFADGEAGPFDDHLAAAILASDWLAAYVAAAKADAWGEGWHAGQQTHGVDPAYWTLNPYAEPLRAVLPAEHTGEDA